jgi:hypothetical protein
MTQRRPIEAAGRPAVVPAAWSCSSCSTLIERLLADPRRIIAVRKDMHWVRPCGLWTGAMADARGQSRGHARYPGRAARPASASEWKLPYAAIEPPPAGSCTRPKRPLQSSSPPHRCRAQRLPLRREGRLRGQVPADRGGHHRAHQQRTATIDPGDGTHLARRLRFAAPRRRRLISVSRQEGVRRRLQYVSP